MQNLSHLNPGSKLAIPVVESWRAPRYLPSVSNRIITVDRKTKTQLISSDANIRVRIKDGSVVGEEYYAIEATTEVIAQRTAQTAEINRYRMALKELDGLIGKSLTYLNLSTDQIEHLAKAWKEVHAMKEIT
jgi:hypothetical protein